MRPAPAPFRWIGIPGLTLASLTALAVAVAMLAAGHNADRVSSALQAGLGLVLVTAAALAVQLRYPSRPLGKLLFALAAVYVLLALQASGDPLLFTIGRATRPVAEVMLVWVMLAFPSGRLTGWVERALVLAMALAVLCLWLPSAMLTAQIPIAGPHITCQPDCPRNVLFVAERPDWSHGFAMATRAVGTFLLVATAGVLFNRLRRATPLMRRVLAPVLVASIARALVTAAFLLGIGGRLAFTLSFWAVPVSIVLGLLRGRLYTAKALQRLVSGLRGTPDMHELRSVMAHALGDPSLSVAYWLKERDHWVDADGQRVALPYPTSERGRAVTLVKDAQGGPVAALVHDEALMEEPTLVESVAGSMQLALESHRLEAEVKASSARTATAVEQERHRIERDLHDGAQQRLIALRMKLSVTSRLFHQDPRRAEALVAEMGGDVEAAIVELRALAHGVVPPLLLERGLADALYDVTQRAHIPIEMQVGEVGRCDPAVERGVYFCCLEALQNAAKHGGPQARARLTLERDGDTLRFSVFNESAVAPDPAHPNSQGQGLANMRGRMADLGGRLTAEAVVPNGFRVTGDVRLRHKALRA